MASSALSPAGTVAAEAGSVSSWTGADVSSWIFHLFKDSANQASLVEIFERHAIDGEKLLKLTAEDVERIGVAKFGQRKKICSKIQDLKKAEACQSEGEDSNQSFEESFPSWLPQGHRLWRLPYTRRPAQFKEVLVANQELKSVMIELDTGTLIFVPHTIRDYVQRLIEKGHEDVANLCGTDVICTCAYRKQIESALATIPRSKTKPKSGGISCITTDARVSPDTVGPELTDKTVGKRIEGIDKNGFIEVRHYSEPLSDCTASTTNFRVGPERNPRWKEEESRARISELMTKRN